ncbi:MAG: type II toxin-antitoxin system VapC family toxin [Pseudomonadota bacterium]
MYLLDTNVISEARKGRTANRGVIGFFQSNLASDLYIAVQSIGEIRRGVENIRRRGDRVQAERLESWLGLILLEYADRILGFDSECAQLWGRLMSPQATNPVDKQIAAIALIHGLPIVTRNERDFAATGATVLNPFL